MLHLYLKFIIHLKKTFKDNILEQYTTYFVMTSVAVSVLKENAKSESPCFKSLASTHTLFTKNGCSKVQITESLSKYNLTNSFELLSKMFCPINPSLVNIIAQATKQQKLSYCFSFSLFTTSSGGTNTFFQYIIAASYPPLSIF